MSYITLISTFFTGKLGKLIIFSSLAIGLYFIVAHEISLRVDLATATKEAAEWKKKAEDLDLKIKTIDSNKKVTDTILDTVDKSNTDLLCLARYGVELPTSIPPATPEPTIVEVVKYRDRVKVITQPTDTPAPVVKNDPVISDKVSVAVLNNTWKAYCAATGNKDDVCIPFRK
jgi:hypothetical protein